MSEAKDFGQTIRLIISTLQDIAERELTPKEKNLFYRRFFDRCPYRDLTNPGETETEVRKRFNQLRQRLFAQLEEELRREHPEILDIIGNSISQPEQTRFFEKRR